MIIKVILYLVAYLFIGITFLELELWHDRKVDYIKRLIVDPKDDAELITTVILWPVILPITVIFGLIYLIKEIKIFFIAIVYLIATIIDMESEE